MVGFHALQGVEEVNCSNVSGVPSVTLYTVTANVIRDVATSSACSAVSVLKAVLLCWAQRRE